MIEWQKILPDTRGKNCSIQANVILPGHNLFHKLQIKMDRSRNYYYQYQSFKSAEHFKLNHRNTCIGFQTFSCPEISLGQPYWYTAETTEYYSILQEKMYC